MRITVLATAATLALLGASSVRAETTVIERGTRDVVVDRPASESKTVTTHDHGDGCSTKSVSKENDVGDRKTVTRESCD